MLNKKKIIIIFSVFLFHLLFILLLQPSQSDNKNSKIAVREIRSLKPSLTAEKAPVKKSAQAEIGKKTTMQKSALAGKKSNAAPKLDNALKNALDSWDAIFKEESLSLSEELIVPAKVSINFSSSEKSAISDNYSKKLLEFFEERVALPEKGKAKIELTITSEGKAINIALLSSESKKNSAFLKKHLPNLVFPCFNDNPLPKKYIINVHTK